MMDDLLSDVDYGPASIEDLDDMFDPSEPADSSQVDEDDIPYPPFWE